MPEGGQRPNCFRVGTRATHDRLEPYGRLCIGIGGAPGLGDAERFERPKKIGVFLGRHHADEASLAARMVSVKRSGMTSVPV